VGDDPVSCQSRGREEKPTGRLISIHQPKRYRVRTSTSANRVKVRRGGHGRRGDSEKGRGGGAGRVEARKEPVETPNSGGAVSGAAGGEGSRLVKRGDEGLGMRAI